MQYLVNGEIGFNNFYEMIYDFCIENSIGIDKNTQYMYDQESGNIIQFKGQNIKASIDPNIPVYAGMNEIVFDPIHNFALMSTLFGRYLDLCANSEEGDMLQGYIAHCIEDDKVTHQQKVIVKTRGRGDISSEFYNNVFLAFIDITFRIAGYTPNIRNFDIVYE